MKRQNNFNVGFPQSVNADHQEVEVIHKEVDPVDNCDEEDQRS